MTYTGTHCECGNTYWSLDKDNIHSLPCPYCCIKELEAEVQNLKDEDEGWHDLLELHRKREQPFIEQMRKDGLIGEMTLPDYGSLLEFITNENKRQREALDKVLALNNSIQEENRDVLYDAEVGNLHSVTSATVRITELCSMISEAKELLKDKP